MSFETLKKPELVAAARAFGADEDGTAAEIRASLLENGVTWEMYQAAFAPKQEPEPEPAPEPQTPNVIKSSDITPAKEVNTVTETTEVVTAEAVPQLQAQKNYLVKMTRENPYFEFGKYKFTQENPYAIMTAEDAQRILSSEEGFRQAFPAELQEFYS